MAALPAQPLELNEEEQRIYERLGECFDQERKRVAKLLADKDDTNLLGQTEFDLRDRVHALGAKARRGGRRRPPKKGAGTRKLASSASAAAGTHAA